MLNLCSAGREGLVAMPFETEADRLNDVAVRDELGRIKSMARLLFDAASAIADRGQKDAMQVGLDSTEFLLDRLIDEIEARIEEAQQ